MKGALADLGRRHFDNGNVAGDTYGMRKAQGPHNASLLNKCIQEGALSPHALSECPVLDENSHLPHPLKIQRSRFSCTPIAYKAF